MHSAPSVSFPVGRSLFSAVLAVGLCLMAAAVLGLWLVRDVQWSWRHALCVAVWGASTLWIFLAWLRSPEGELKWDGQTWYWPQRVAGGEVVVTMDLQFCILLGWLEAGSSRPLWLWLERRSDPAQWFALRRAVYSRASTAEPPDTSRAAPT